ncbi:MAG TPA: type II toxin-antitoxin system RelE/ParE family toxin [Pirellulaceae bacterium]|nr:type II toxin-antitoxin system RelE/ParE family toxin [Pirellulaceae bacterium]
MSYQLFIHRSAEKALTAIPKDDHDAVMNAIVELANNPRPHRCKKLVDRDGWRIRVGSYGVIYEIDDSRRTVTIVKVGHRRDIYL